MAFYDQALKVMHVIYAMGRDSPHSIRKNLDFSSPGRSVRNTTEEECMGWNVLGWLLLEKNYNKSKS